MSSSPTTNPGSAESPDTPVRPTRTELITYSIGGAASNLGNGVINALKYPILNMLLEVRPGMISTLAGIARLWDAVTDPAMGQISDRARTRWGRRRPFILVGGILASLILMGLYWMDAGWSSNRILIFYGTLLLLFNTATTIIGVPYFALGIEMGTSYDERTRVVAYRSFFEKIMGFASQWYFRFTEYFSNALVGARWLTAILGLVGITTTVLVTVRNREHNYKTIARKTLPKEGFFHTLSSVLANRTYARLLFIWTVLTLNTGVFAAIGNYLNVYYVYGGDKAKGATLGAIVGSFALTLSMLAIPLTKLLCDRWGKHRVLMLALWLYAIGSVLKWWCINPEHPWLQLILPFFFSIGISSIYIVMSAMQADVVDLDELETNQRREGMFGAMGGLIMKIGGSVAIVLSGWVIEWTGFEVTDGGAQQDGVFLWMRICFSLIPAVGSILALVAVRNWPLTRKRCEEIRVELEERRATALKRDTGTGAA